MKKLKIHFLNTIWSDAILLENNNKYAFIDTGSLFYYPMIENHLNERNIKELEFIINTIKKQNEVNSLNQTYFEEKIFKTQQNNARIKI